MNRHPLALALAVLSMGLIAAVMLFSPSCQPNDKGYGTLAGSFMIRGCKEPR